MGTSLAMPTAALIRCLTLVLRSLEHSFFGGCIVGKTYHDMFISYHHSVRDLNVHDQLYSVSCKRPDRSLLIRCNIFKRTVEKST